nr:auxin-responsive protein IAA27-like [Tanacetum cinerariifolium]
MRIIHFASWDLRVEGMCGMRECKGSDTVRLGAGNSFVDDGAQVVGWTPIRSLRKNTMATKGFKIEVAYEGSSGSRGCLYAQLHGLWRKSFTIVSQLWFLLIGLLSLETDGDDVALMSIDSKGTNFRIRQVCGIYS